MTLLCPLCSGCNFSSEEILLHSLISSSTQNIICPVCADVLRGIDKFTVHLCSHILIKCDQKPVDLNSDGGITHIDKKFKNIRLNVSSHTPNDGTVLANNNSRSSANFKRTERLVDSTNRSPKLTAGEMNGMMSSYSDNVSSIIGADCNYLSRSVDAGESETANFPTNQRPDNNSVRFTDSFNSNYGENSVSNALLNAPDNVTFETYTAGTQPQLLSNCQPDKSDRSSAHFPCGGEFANPNSTQLTTSPECDLSSVRTVVSDFSHDIGNSESDFLSQLTSILDQTADDYSFGTNLSADQLERTALAETNNDDCLPETDKSGSPPSQAHTQNTTCNICFVSLPDDVGILRLHKELVHDKNPVRTDFKYNCTLCKRKFKIKGSLSIHQQVAHSDGKSKHILPGQLPNDEIQHRCNICSKMFKKEYLNQHLKTHEEKKWACESCGKLFTTKYFLQKHKRLHTGEMPYVCPICDKQFTFQQTYHKHLIYHNDEKPYSCKECGKSFKELSTLYNHQRIHSGEKPYSCDICGKNFRQRVSCIIHSRIHTGLKPFACLKCRKSFRYKISLKSHKCVQEPNFNLV